MRDKDKYLNALKQSNGRYNAVDLGAQIGLNEAATMLAVAQLLSEFKIEYIPHGHCDYSVMKSKKQHKKME